MTSVTPAIKSQAAGRVNCKRKEKERKRNNNIYNTDMQNIYMYKKEK